MILLNKCPLCGGSTLNDFIKSKDYFFTGQEFTIQKCNDCGLKITNPRPEEIDLSSYYNSQEYLSHSSGKNDVKSVLYRMIRNFNLNTKFQKVRSSSNGENILDIGCGTGEFLDFCKRKGMSVIGIEPNKKARDYGRDHYKLTIEDETYLNKEKTTRFDVITLWHVLEHVPDLNQRLQQIRRILNPGGMVFIAVPNVDSWDAIHYERFWAAFDLPRHLYHFNKQTLDQLVTQNGFKVVKFLPMKWDSYFISLLSEKYKSGKENYFAAFINGMRSNISARKNNMNYSSIISVLKLS